MQSISFEKLYSVYGNQKPYEDPTDIGTCISRLEHHNIAITSLKSSKAVVVCLFLFLDFCGNNKVMDKV